MGAAEPGRLPDVVEPEVDIGSDNVVSLEGRVPLEGQEQGEAPGHENLHTPAIGEIIQAADHQDGHRHEEEHRGNVVAMLVDQFEGDDGPLDEVIQKEKKHAR